jgi:hypothetical protein
MDVCRLELELTSRSALQSSSSLWWPVEKHLNPHPSHKPTAQRMRHPQNQHHRFGRCGRVDHPPVTVGGLFILTGGIIIATAIT